MTDEQKRALHNASKALIACGMKGDVAHIESLLAAGAKPTCPNCNGTGSHGGRFHTDGKGDSEYEPYKCEVCDGFGTVAAPPAPSVADAKPCTCHPDDNPPVPCAKQYALSECRSADNKENN